MCYILICSTASLVPSLALCRYLVNPAQKVVWKTPRKRFVIDVYKKVVGSSYYVIPIEDAEDVMGPMDDHNCAEMLRSYLAGKNPAAELATLAVPHVPRALKVNK